MSERSVSSHEKLPPHPGEVLADWMQGRRQTIAETASLLGVSAGELGRVVAGDVAVSGDLAVRLEEAGWGTAESWLGTQAVREVAEARERSGIRDRTVDAARRRLDLGFDIYHRTDRGPKPRYRPRCASIVVASPGPAQGRIVETRFGEMRCRDGALLKQTGNDAERVHEMWRDNEPDVSGDLSILLVDPSLRQLSCTIRQISKKLDDAYPDDIGLDFFFAGHGLPCTGDLVLRDGMLTPEMLLGLQARETEADRGERTIGVWLDSCYSGAFLIRLAIRAFEDFVGFRLDEGLASCLPNEVCFEMDSLQHGVFTYTRLHPGNRHVDSEYFNRAILRNDRDGIAKWLQGLVGVIGSPSAFLTEGEQFSMSLTKHVLDVDGDYATVELGEKNDYDEVVRKLTGFKDA